MTLVMEEQMGAPGTQSQENAKVLTTREIQQVCHPWLDMIGPAESYCDVLLGLLQKLEENAMLLEAINERQNMNSLKDCAEYVIFPTGMLPKHCGELGNE